MKTPLLAFASAALLVPIQPAIAQESNDLRIRVGLGGQIRPEYLGAKGSEWGPLWDFSMARGSNQFDFDAPDDNFDLELLSSGGLSVGPVANIRKGRTNSEVGAPVGKVPTTVEVGAFAQYYISESMRLRAEVRRGIGGHDGLIARLGGDYVWRDGDRYLFSIGPRLLFSDSRFQRAWFGVTPEASAATGLPVYRPNAGLHAIAATSGVNYQLSRDFGLFGFARYERLVGDAAQSPIVRVFGSKNQFSAGAGLTYTFTIRR